MSDTNDYAKHLLNQWFQEEMNDLDTTMVSLRMPRGLLEQVDALASMYTTNTRSSVICDLTWAGLKSVTQSMDPDDHKNFTKHCELVRNQKDQKVKKRGKTARTNK